MLSLVGNYFPVCCHDIIVTFNNAASYFLPREKCGVRTRGAGCEREEVLLDWSFLGSGGTSFVVGASWMGCLEPIPRYNAYHYITRQGRPVNRLTVTTENTTLVKNVLFYHQFP